MALIRDRRPYQDFTQWLTYGTAPFWGRVHQNPMEESVQLLNRMGCVNPSELTSKEVTAGVLTIMYGNMVPYLNHADINGAYSTFKVSLCTAVLIPRISLCSSYTYCPGIGETRIEKSSHSKLFNDIQRTQ
jgi:hypothetical protein